MEHLNLNLIPFWDIVPDGEAINKKSNNQMSKLPPQKYQPESR